MAAKIGVLSCEMKSIPEALSIDGGKKLQLLIQYFLQEKTGKDGQLTERINVMCGYLPPIILTNSVVSRQELVFRAMLSLSHRLPDLIVESASDSPKATLIVGEVNSQRDVSHSSTSGEGQLTAHMLLALKKNPPSNPDVLGFIASPREIKVYHAIKIPTENNLQICPIAVYKETNNIAVYKETNNKGTIIMCFSLVHVQVFVSLPITCKFFLLK